MKTVICDSYKCENMAMIEVFWPGQTRRMCFTHAERATNVARAMGFELASRPLVLTQGTSDAGESE